MIEAAPQLCRVNAQHAVAGNCKVALKNLANRIVEFRSILESIECLGNISRATTLPSSVWVRTLPSFCGVFVIAGALAEAGQVLNRTATRPGRTLRI